MTSMQNDIDPTETQEWLDAFDSIIRHEGDERANFIAENIIDSARKNNLEIANRMVIATPYCNTIPVDQQLKYPGNLELENRIEAINRWNAIALVLKAKKEAGGIGGHLSSYASIASLYEVGLNHFFRAPSQNFLGDLIYFQGHSTEGNYARAFLEGRITEEQLNYFRRETGGKGISSYPHPWLMPNFWQFATVSLGLGALQAIYQARFLKYLENRGLLPAEDRKVWLFCGDGEMDEPEAIAGLTMAAREKLDNMIYVVNCNLQRLDGLVRSNGKIVQELEKVFQGAGWNVIKVLWGSKWDSLFVKDHKGLLLKRLNECVDGDLQNAYVRGGAYTREFIFGTDPELKEMVADLSDDEIAQLNRGAHDYIKIYSAYAAAIKHRGQPTVILFQGVKGYGLGTTGAESRNVAHNQLEMLEAQLKLFRDRFKLPLTDKQLLEFHFYKPADDSPEILYLREQRAKLGGFLPVRQKVSNPLEVPPLSAFDKILKGSEERTMSTTMVLGRIFNVLFKDSHIGKRIVPIFSDEVRTFGLEAFFRQIGIYSSVGQLYTPEDKEQLVYYHESKDGQLLEEGITEAGSISSWIAAATSYSTHRFPMIPFFTYYSMFGFQRVGDFIWASGDMRARGFLIGATAGRTTLEGEGLQHQDGHSLLVASAIPNCRSYDPAFGYELAVIIQDGLRCMYQEEQDVFYYIMTMNEKYEQPEMPKDVANGIIKGMYLLKGSKKSKLKVQLMGSGTILREVIFAAELLQNDFNIMADVWSVTSFNELHRDGANVIRENMLNPESKPKLCFIESCLQNHDGPVIAATDYVRSYPNQIRPYISRSYTVLGTDGFGRSDTRENLRQFFEVDRYYIVVAALYALAKEEAIPMSQVASAIKKYKIDPKKPNPMTI
ncbi:MAG: pyruvate dehydrogenase (acetyl-transferring), homodimeric type [Gammaproteobacteria bacterium]